MAIRIMVMAGGTGGHVFPALAVARHLRDAGHQVTWLGTKKGIEARLVPDAGFDIDWLSVSGLRGKGLLSLLLAPFMLIKACWQASRIIRQRQPDVVLGLGGFASGPGGLMSWLHRKPLVIHEQNRVPGTTNRLLTRFANRVLEAFPGSFDQSTHAIFSGNPIRQELLGIEVAPVNSTRHILVLGGSLGASILNTVVPAALKDLQQELAIEVIHQAGETTLDMAISNYKEMTVKADIRSFIADMKAVYQWADIVICRAGAMTVSELAMMGLPAIFVPLPHAIDDHQTKNAAYLADQGAARLVHQYELTADRLAAILKEILTNQPLRATMANKARSLAKPEATKIVADSCLEVAL